MSDGTVNVGIIGCGRVSGHHCRSIMETPGTRLVAVCDLVEERANLYRDQFGAKAYVNYHEMLRANPDIDVVAIITPSGMHFEHGIDIINRYCKHLIVEKPTFMKPSQVTEAYRVARAAGVKVFPVFQNRHNRAVRRVMKGLRDGELGNIRSVAVRVRWCRPQRYYDLAPWRGTYAMDGGCLTNQGIHHIDLMRLLGGDVVRVAATHATLGAEIEVEDTASATLQFASGAVGTVEITTAARPIDYEASLSLVCEKGLAQIGGIAVNELQIYTPEPGACAENSEDFSGNVYGHGHGQMYRDIAAFFREGISYPVTEAQTLSTIQLLNSLYVAYESRAWVEVQTAGDSNLLGRCDEKLADLYRTVLPVG